MDFNGSMLYPDSSDEDDADYQNLSKENILTLTKTEDVDGVWEEFLRPPVVQNLTTNCYILKKQTEYLKTNSGGNYNNLLST